MKTFGIVVTIMLSLKNIASCIRCFECDNKVNPACGVDFKSYQYEANVCLGGESKCGLQRQPQIGDFIGIMRRCHVLGSNKEINESDGCHTYVARPHNYTFEICFCSENFCNASDVAIASKWTIAIASSAYTLTLRFLANR